MDKVKLAIIFNPAARGEKARSLEKKMRSLTEADAFLLSRSGEAGALVRKLAQEGYSTIVAAGGDGTVNEVVNGIVGLDVSLGILPIGTMNVLAYELGLPTTQLEQCWEIIQRGFTRSIDLAIRGGTRQDRPPASQPFGRFEQAGRPLPLIGYEPTRGPAGHGH